MTKYQVCIYVDMTMHTVANLVSLRRQSRGNVYLDPCFSFNSLTVLAILSSNRCLFDGRGSLTGGLLRLQPHDNGESEESSESVLLPSHHNKMFGFSFSQ